MALPGPPASSHISPPLADLLRAGAKGAHMLVEPAGACRPRSKHASTPQPAPARRGLHCHLVIVICSTPSKADRVRVSSNAINL
jgi:hypothetical protein